MSTESSILLLSLSLFSLSLNLWLDLKITVHFYR